MSVGGGKKSAPDTDGPMGAWQYLEAPERLIQVRDSSLGPLNSWIDQCTNRIDPSVANQARARRLDGVSLDSANAEQRSISTGRTS